MQWIRHISALFLLIAFSFQCFNKAFIVIDYYNNIGQYAKLCINKSRPKLHCNGRCAMMKKLKAEEKSEQQDPERKGENKLDITSINSFLLAITINKVYFLKKEYPILQSPKAIKRSFEIFHPPSC